MSTTAGGPAPKAAYRFLRTLHECTLKVKIAAMIIPLRTNGDVNRPIMVGTCVCVCRYSVLIWERGVNMRVEGVKKIRLSLRYPPSGTTRRVTRKEYLHIFTVPCIVAVLTTSTRSLAPGVTIAAHAALLVLGRALRCI